MYLWANYEYKHQLFLNLFVLTQSDRDRPDAIVANLFVAIIVLGTCEWTESMAQNPNLIEIHSMDQCLHVGELHAALLPSIVDVGIRIYLFKIQNVRQNMVRKQKAKQDPRNQKSITKIKSSIKLHTHALN